MNVSSSDISSYFCPPPNSRKYFRKNLMMDHLHDDVVHVERRKLYCCPQCQKSYTQKRNMIRHLRYECGVEPKFQCQYCSFKAKQKANLKSHIWFKHSEKALTENY